MADSDVYVVWDEAVTGYDFGPSHPMHPLRLDLTAKLAIDFELFDRDGVDVRSISDLDEAALARVHDDDYITAVKEAGSPAGLDHGEAERFGLGTDDVPVFENMHSASAMLFQGSVDAARAITSGDYRRAVNFSGGMHHAMADRASGFCVYNDVAGAITEFLDAGFERIVYIDLDAHHGDGVEALFWDDPRVLTISIHESGKYLFPGTVPGRHRRTPGGRLGGEHRPAPAHRRRGLAARLRRHRARPRRGLLPAGHRLPARVRRTPDGPLTHMRLSIDAMRVATERVRRLAEDHAEGRWLSTGGGGYAIIDVVPRAWTNLIAIAADADIDPGTRIPGRWAHYAQTKTGREAPLTMTDGFDGSFTPWSHGFDPETELDRAVMGTRKNLFPFFGLDPYFD